MDVFSKLQFSKHGAAAVALSFFLNGCSGMLNFNQGLRAPSSNLEMHYKTEPMPAGTEVSFSPIISFASKDTSIAKCWMADGSTLAPGLNLDPQTCVIYGTPTKEMPPTNVQIIVEDSKGQQSTATVRIEVQASPPTVKYGNGNTLSPVIGSAFTVLPQTEDYGSPIQSCSTSGLPLGLSLDPSNCTITGIAMGSPSTGSYAVTVSNKAGSRTVQVPIDVIAGAPKLIYPTGTASAPLGSVFNLAPDTLVSNGAAITNCIADASTPLPTGLSINPTTCNIVGTPTTVTSAADYTVKITNSAGTTDATISLRVVPGLPVITYPALSGQTSGSPAIAASGSAFTVTPTVQTNGSSLTNCAASPALPTGLTISTSTCAVSGTTTASASSTDYTITATNGAGSATTHLFLDVTSGPPTLSYNPSTAATLGTSITINPTSLVKNATNLIGCTATSLPSGLSINGSTCVITGTPNGSTGTATVTVTATNTAGSGTANLDIVVSAGSPTVAYSSPATATIGTAFTATATVVTNGSAITNCTATGLPAGLNISAATCTISGTPTGSAGSSTVAVIVTNAIGNNSGSVTINVGAGLPALTYASGTHTGQAGSAFSLSTQSLVTNGAAITSCGIKSGSSNQAFFPTSLSINASTCVISGTPTATLSPITFTVVAHNSAGDSADANVTLEFTAGLPELSYATSSGTSGAIGVAMSVQPSTRNSNGAAITACGIKSGSANAASFPGTLSIDANTCAITGTPTATLSATQFTLVAHNSVGDSADALVTLGVGAGVPTLQYAATNTGTVGSAASFAATLNANGSSITACGIKAGSANAASFPSTLSINATTCNITGTPDALLSSTQFTVRVTNAAGSTDALITISVVAGVPTLSYSTSTGVNGVINTAMSVTPSTRVANGASITSCGLKPGSANAASFPGTLSINATTCVITGTPTATLASTQFTLIAHNSVGDSADALVTLSVAAGAPILNYGSNGTISTPMGVAVNTSPITLTDNGAAVTACGIKAGSPNAGSFPGTLSINATTCAITGTPTALLATTSFTIVATNSSGTSADATISLTVGAGVPDLSYAASTGKTGTVGIAMSVTPSTLNDRGSAITSCAIKSGSANAGLFPSSLSIGATDCKITGTPVAALSSTTYTLVATNAIGTSTDATVALVVNAAVPTLDYTGATGTTGTVGTAMSITPFKANGNGAAITSCGIKSGSANAASFPGTLSVNATTCVISGTPTATLASTQFTLVAHNSVGDSADATVTLQINAAVPNIQYADTNGNIGDTLNVSPTLKTNGASITNCRIKSGSANAALFPTALSINSTTCAITGTLAQTLASTLYTIEAINSVGSSVETGNFRLAVGASAPTLVYGGNYSFKLGSSSGTLTTSTLNSNGANITSCTGSGLPSGVTVNNTDCSISFSGTGSLTSSAGYTITATNSQGSTNATATFSIDAGVPTLAYPGATQNGTVASALSITSSTVTGNGASITACAIKSGSANAGIFPASLSINATNCSITGTPTASLSATTYTLVATNSVGNSADATVTIAIGASVPSLDYTSATGKTGTVGSAMSVVPNRADSNGAAITSCAIKSGSANAASFPSTLTVNASSCNITGTPTAVLASTQFTLVAHNSVGDSADALVTLQINAGVPTLDYASATGKNGTVGTAMSVTPVVNNQGAAVSSCGIKSGSANAASFPGTLSINASTCAITGTPTAVLASTQFTIVAHNSAGDSADALVTLSVGAGVPTVDYASATGKTGTVGTAMSVTPVVSNQGATITSCGIKSGSANAGSFPGTLSINSSTCAITGTPTAVLASTQFTIVAHNSVGDSADATVTLQVNAGVPSLSYSSATGTSVAANTAMSVTPVLTANGASVTSCAIKSGSANAGSFPGTLSINATTCVITGTPTAVMSGTQFTIVAQNSAGDSADATVTLTVTGGVPTLSYASATGTTGTVGTAMSITPTLTANGASVTSCGIKSGSPNAGLFPAGLSINSSSCVISGTPTGSLSSTQYTIVAHNSNGDSADATVTLVINAAIPTLSYSGSTGTTGAIGNAMSVTPFTANGNGAAITSCGIKSGSTNAGSFPGTLSVNATSCVISGTPTALLSSTQFTLVAHNSVGDSADATVTLAIGANVPNLIFTGATGTSGQVGTAMSVTPPTADGRGASITSCGIKSGSANAGSFPAGLSVNATTCVISGTPTASISATQFTLVAHNSVGDSADATVTLTVTGGVPTFDYIGATGTTGSVGVSMSVSPTHINNNGSSIDACGIKSGSTNESIFTSSGLSVSTSCVISGSPTTAFAATAFTLRAHNSAGYSADVSVTLTVNAGAPSLSYAASSGKTITLGSVMSVTPTLNANGASVSSCGIKSGSTNAGSFPGTLSINATTCVISGTPTSTMPATQFTIVAHNSAGDSADATVTLQVNANGGGSIATNSLILNLDAAKASGGTAAYAPDTCGGTWTSTSPATINGSFSAYSGCRTGEGFQGDGTVASPYRLNMQGGMAWDYGGMGGYASGTGINSADTTLDTWINRGTTAVAYQTLFNVGYVYYGEGWNLGFTADGKTLQICVSIMDPNYGYPNMTCIPADTQTADNTWYHVSMTINSTTQETHFYVNSREVTQSPILGAYYSPYDATVKLGDPDCWDSCQMPAIDMAKLAIYNRALDGGEVAQNCLALQSRFGITCDVPALTTKPANLILSLNELVTISGSGGVSPYTLSKTSGVGTFNAGTGLYTAPGSPGSAVIHVEDAFGSQADSTVRVINPPTITTSSLAFNLDAATASSSAGAYSSGCSGSQMTWYDSSSSTNNGTLNNFSSCDSNLGWLGSGTTADPYRLKFNGGQNISLATPPTGATSSVSFESWINLPDTNQHGAFFKFGDSNNGTGGYGVGVGNSQANYDGNHLIFWAEYVGWYDTGKSLGTGWMQITMTMTASKIYFYKNAKLLYSMDKPTLQTPASTLLIGGYGDFDDRWMRQPMAKFAYYTKTLNQGEIARNCFALRSRFTGVTCDYQPLNASPSMKAIAWNTNYTINASGGLPPYTFTVSSGTGSVNSTTGVFHSPSVNETDTIAVTDLTGNSINVQVRSSDNSACDVAFCSGTGTPADPYIIGHPINICEHMIDMSKNYKLAHDIDMSTFSCTFQPLIALSGIFDGDGHKISNLTLSAYGIDDAGLFATITGGTVKNLRLSQVNITSTKNHVGTLVGQFNSGTLKNILVESGSASGYDAVGGVIGWVYNTGVSSVTASGTFATVNSSHNYGGGFVGLVESHDAPTRTITFLDDFARGNVTASYDRAGGFVGNANCGNSGWCSYDNSFAIGTVTSTYNKGGFSAYNDNNDNRYYDVFWDATTSGIGTSTGGSPKDTTAMQQLPAYLNLGFDMVNTWGLVSSGADYPHLRYFETGLLPQTPYFDGGDGSSGTPFQIANATQFNNISLITGNLSKYFVLTSDIDFASKPAAMAGNTHATFSGSIDGQGHTISNVSITNGDVRGTDDVGLVGQMSAGTIKNIKLTNITINTPNSSHVGALVGQFNKGTIQNILVTSGTISGYDAIGGMIGWVFNLGSSSVTASGSFATVSSSHTWGGGFVGYVESHDSSARTISFLDDFARGNVTASYDRAGGFVGSSNCGNSSWCSYDNSFAIGTVTSTYNKGGFSSYNDNNDNRYYDVFWDATTSGIGTSAAGSPKTTTAMQQLPAYLNLGWDFVTTWGLVSSGSDYPHLRYFESGLLPQAPYFAGGDGSSGTPYQIATVTQFNNMALIAANLTKYFVLTTDLDFASKPSVMLGNTHTPFSGNFDGQGHSISNISISNADVRGTDDVGLIGQMSDGAVKNIKLTNITINTANSSHVGALVGQFNKGTIQNILVTSGTISGYDAIGGMIGWVFNLGSSSVTASGSFATVSSSHTWGGGFVGYVESHDSSARTISFLDDFARGNVTASYDRAGGFVGSSNCGNSSWCSYDNSFAIGTVTSTYNKGGFSSYNDNNDNRYYDVFWDATTSGIGTSAAGSPKTTTAMQQLPAYLNLGWDFVTTWGLVSSGTDYPHLRYFESGLLPQAPYFAGGDGSSGSPYQIANVTQFNNVALVPSNLSKYFTLTADIDFSSKPSTMLGNSHTNFTGSFDGQGHSVSNISFTNADVRGTDDVGFIGQMSDGTVKNLKLSNITINTPNSSHVGALVGQFNKGTVQNILVSSGAITGYDAVGGVLGYVFNTGASSVTASGSYATVNSGRNWGGGFVGYVESHDSSARTISFLDDFARGNVTASYDRAGGFVGSSNCGNSSWCSYDNSFATGTVTSTYNKGGFVSYNDNNDNRYYDIFWDKTTSSITTSASGIGLTTTYMQQLPVYLNAGWDFTSVWGMDSAGSAYPQLRYFTSGLLPQAPYFAGGDGSSGNPYQIANATQWNNVALSNANLAAYYVLTADINMGSTGPAFIGNNHTAFSGNFNGQGHNVSNVSFSTANVPDTSNIGLFARVTTNATIKNLKLSSITVNLPAADNVGALIGLADGGTVQNVLVASGAVTGHYNVGGMIGQASVDSGASNISFNAMGTHASVTGTDSVGGFIGYTRAYNSTRNVTIDNSYAQGAVTSSSWAGGFVGYSSCEYNSSYCSFDHSYSTGAITSPNKGGFDGRNDYGNGRYYSVFWDETTTGTTTNGANGGPKTTAAAKQMGSYSSMGFDFESTWGMADYAGTDYARLKYFYPSSLPQAPFFAGGDGSVGDPYQISTEAQFNAASFASKVSSNFIMTANINFGGRAPGVIGSTINPFSGNFNGNGKILSNITFSSHASSNTDQFGLFGRIRGGTVRNLRVDNINITGDNSDNVGALVGLLEWGTLQNVIVTSGAVSGRNNVGGLVGSINTDANVGNVTINAAGTHASASGNDTIGGFVGYMRNYNTGRTVTVSDVYAQGAVTSNSWAGGFVGYSSCEYNGSYCSVDRGYATGLITSPNKGGFDGRNDYGNGRYEDITWDQTSTGTTTNGFNAYPKKTSGAKQIGGYTAMGFDFGATWAMSDYAGTDYPELRYFYPSYYPTYPAFAGGDGTSGNPYQINNENAYNAASAAGYYDKYFIMTADINFGGHGVATIGNQDYPFAGQFHGQGHTLSNITFADRAAGGTRQFGLFAYVRGGTVRNLKVSSLSITGDNYDNAGTLVGILDKGTILNVRVSSSSVQGRYNVGGLIGTITTDPSGAGNSSVSNAGTSASVSGADTVGGFAGYVRSYNNGFNIVIDNAYAQGSVTSGSWAGGFVGYSSCEYNSSYCSFDHSYATGAITAPNKGGFTGRNDYGNGRYYNVFWDTTTTGVTTSGASGTGNTTSNMQASSTYTTAGFNQPPWSISGTAYPTLDTSGW